MNTAYTIEVAASGLKKDMVKMNIDKDGYLNVSIFLIFFNPIFPMHSAKIHTFALSFQKTTKCNQYETERCYNGMACRIHYQLYDADGMHRKIQEAREEKRES